MDLNKLVYKRNFLYTRSLLYVIKKFWADIYSSLLWLTFFGCEKSTGVEKSMGLTVLS